MRFKLTTNRGYDFFAASSAMQKAIRRGDAKVAGWFALELYHSKYWEYVWKRLFTISAEDCDGIITKEILALWEGFKLVNKGKADMPKGRIFISKAVIILCDVKKNRDPDHLQNLVYDAGNIDMKLIDTMINQSAQDEYVEIPGYAYDVHTQEGRRKGKTKRDFFKEELAALKDRQPGLFDDLVEKL